MMLLKFEDGRSFAQGACGYRYCPATTREATPRIIVQVQIGDINTPAIVDTGGVYFICEPQIAELIDLDPAEALETDEVNIRGTKCSGALHRVSLTLQAQEGQSIELEVTVFVPSLQPHHEWDLPSFMGLSGCLERLRFAVDPVTDTFYFGALQEA